MLIWTGSHLCASPMLTYPQSFPDIPHRTHVITSTLTPTKVVQFQRMKIVTPEWLVESVKVGKLLPWQNYIFRPENRALPSINKTPAQLSLFSTKVTTTVNPAAEDKHAFPRYAVHRSNPNAARVIENPEWRTVHTSAAPDFIDVYYKNSRLHHLSMWKMELRKLVQEAQQRAEEAPSGSLPRDPVQGLASMAFLSHNDIAAGGVASVMRSPSKRRKEGARDRGRERVIMHCDFDAFFVSAGLLDRKHLRGKPVVVCHSQGDQGGVSSTSEIASASYEAREFGIKNGMRCTDPSTSARLHLTPLVVYSRLESCARAYKPSHTSLTSASFPADV
jgi:DNA repair protein REV1